MRHCVYVALRGLLLALALLVATLAAPGCAGPSQESRHALRRARSMISPAGTKLRALGPGELARLARALRTVVSSGQGRGPAASNLGLVLEALKDETGAGLAYTRALDLDPSHRVALDRGASLDARAGRWDRAATRLLALYDATGGERRVAARLTVALAMAGRLDEGMALAGRLLHERPGDPLAMAALAAAELAAGRIGVAEVLAQKARQADAKSALPHAVLAAVALGRGDHGGVAARLRAGLDAEPASPALALALCNFLLAAGDYAAAERTLRELVRQNLSWARVRVLLGMALIGQARASDAEKVLIEARKRGAVEAFYALGLLRHRLQGRREEALALYQEFIDRGRPPASHPVHQQMHMVMETMEGRGHQQATKGGRS